MSKLNIRTYTWMQGGLSWAYVMDRLMNSFDELGHNTYVASTNGLANNNTFVTKDKMLKSVLGLQSFGPGKKQIDIDITYTVPQNFPQRFLANSKHKCAIYNYETTYWHPDWKKFYGLVDFYFPSSNFSAEVFAINEVPPEKIFVIPHGVDTKVFNPSVPKIQLKTDKKFKFVAVVAPHYRKNIDLLLHAYCQAFTNKDDVCLVLKTKVYKKSDGEYNMQTNPKGRKAFEILLGDVFQGLVKRYGNNMPEIELVESHVENVASIYNACHCHVSTTGSEGFFMPGLETQACGLINIAPRYSGHLDFLNDNNSLLIDTKLRYAKPVEQYWTFNPKGQIGQPSISHTVELMRKVFREYDELKVKFLPEMNKMVDKYSWKYAADLIIKATEHNMDHYVPGTYNWWPE